MGTNAQEENVKQADDDEDNDQGEVKGRLVGAEILGERHRLLDLVGPKLGGGLKGKRGQLRKVNHHQEDHEQKFKEVG